MSYQKYQELFRVYGEPIGLWPQWCAKEKDEELRQLIALGAILVQRTSWKNAEMALKNLKKAGLADLRKIAYLTDLKELKNSIRSAGFYQTKPKRLQEFSKFVVNNYKDLSHMMGEDKDELRNQLLSVYGVGPETADTLLLYSLDKPSFIVDAYTKKFIKKYNLCGGTQYDEVKDYFESGLPNDLHVYQNYHVFIIVDDKGKDWCIMEEV
jgi:endonuclease III related protein